MLVLVGVLVVLIMLLVYVVKIHRRLEKQDQDPSHPMLVKILELLREKQKGHKPRAPSGGPAENPNAPVAFACASGNWRCLESEAGTEVSRIESSIEGDEVAYTFQVPSQPVEEVFWALCQV